MIDLEKLWIQYDRIIKENGAIILTAQTPFDKVL
ncbi:TPA_asm: site-specific DNA-methyltransferase, partial [Listeria monocytogenes]|nr:site-specific DNA-methyltransferase [Listeria monocytogenes]